MAARGQVGKSTRLFFHLERLHQIEKDTKLKARHDMTQAAIRMTRNRAEEDFKQKARNSQASTESASNDGDPVTDPVLPLDRSLKQFNSEYTKRISFSEVDLDAAAAPAGGVGLSRV